MRHSMPVELIEADVEIGFNLVDLAETERSSGHHSLASQILKDAEVVFCDIQQRLLRIGTLESRPFEPLAGELRRAIDRAKARNQALGCDLL